MLTFDRKKVFDGLRAWQGGLSQEQVTGLNFILDSVEQDRYVTRISWLAYMLATVKHETADTYHPIHEYGGRNYFIRRYGGQTAKGRELGNDTPEEGAFYAGQGFVQLTGEANYERMELALRREYPEIVADFQRRTGRTFDLTVGDQPNDSGDSANAQDPMIAYAIMSYGMRNGSFTGRKLSNYLAANTIQDYLHARKIINGMDKAELIAGYAQHFESILRHAQSDLLEVPISPAATPPAEPTPIGTMDKSTTTPSPPAENPSAEQPVTNKFEGVMGSLETYGSKLERVDGTVSKVSQSSVFSYASKMLMAVGAFGVGFIKDNWEWLVVGAVIVIVAGYLWNESKKRANERTITALKNGYH
jgi:hypothetical protein